jgi:hypothetical protein
MKVGNSGGYEPGKIGELDDATAAELEKNAPFKVDKPMRRRMTQMIEEGAHGMAAEPGMPNAGEISEMLAKLERSTRRQLTYLSLIAAERTEMASTLSTELNIELQSPNEKEKADEREPLDQIVWNNNRLLSAIQNTRAGLRKNMEQKNTFGKSIKKDRRGDAADEAKNSLLLGRGDDLTI